MTDNTPAAGDRPRLPAPQRWRRATLDGEPVVYVALGNSDREVVVCLDTWDLYIALGYPHALFLRDNGKGRMYLSHSFDTPGVIETNPRDFARTLLAIIRVREEMQGGPRADLKGQQVVLLSGFDLRDDNLETRGGKVRGGGWQAVADVRKRWAIRFPADGSPGQDPNAHFASVRRARKTANERAGQAALEGGPVEPKEEEPT